jgi:hypothetical protein
LERCGLVAFAIVACSNPAELDRRDLKAAVAFDAPLDDALARAESESKLGHDDAAIDILKRTAESAASAAVSAASAVAPRTAWGRQEKDALVSVETERRDEVERYERALSGADLEDKLAATEKQIDLERRAIALFAEISHEP